MEHTKYSQVQDKRIFNLLCNGKGPRGYIQSPNRRRLKSHKRPLPNIWEYMSTRFSWVNAWPETSNIVELLYCIDNHIEEQPVCKTCGKPIHFRAKMGRYGWYCNQKCQQNSEENKAKMVKSLKENNPDLGKHISKSLMSKPIEERQAAARKRKQTIAERHDGNENWVNVESIKATCAKRTEEERHAIGQKVVKARTDKWGPKGMPEESIESMKQKAKLRWSNPDERDKQAQRVHKHFASLNEEEKRKHAERSALAWANKSEEEQQRITEKRTQKILNKTPEEKAEILRKRQETFAKNRELGLHGGHKSNDEDNTFIRLKRYIPELERYVRDARYANENGAMFECDFYVPSKDAFIECQFHQSHGNSPYTFGQNPTEDKANIDFIISQGYDTETFLRRDPEKRKAAKEHNLNYFELWHRRAPYKELMELAEKINKLPNIK